MRSRSRWTCELTKTSSNHDPSSVFVVVELAGTGPVGVRSTFAVVVVEVRHIVVDRN